MPTLGRRLVPAARRLGPRRSRGGLVRVRPVNELGEVLRPTCGSARIEHEHEGVIVGTLRIVPQPERRAEVLEILRSVQGPVRAQPGCASCHIYEEQGPERAVVLVEMWDSQAALETHIRSEAYRRVLGAVELSGGPPEVRFDHVSATEGMELIERSRNPGGSDGGR